jgi:hypothetical protein
MQRNMTILASLAVVAAFAGAIGCSSSSPNGTGSSGSNTSTPVSFKTDIIPIFQQSCTLSMECHGQPNNAGELNLYLGLNPNTGPNTAATIMMAYQALVGVNSVEDPAMPLVKPMDTTNSYILYKLNGTQNSTASVSSECAKNLCGSSDCTAATPCGALMPDTAAMPIAMDEIQTITDWISQGAPNN